MAENINFDREFCGNLAIHQTNSIQDYGYLLVLETSTLNIIQGSENIADLTGSDIRAIVGKPFGDFLSTNDKKRFTEEAARGERNRVPFNCVISSNGFDKALNIILHINGDIIMMEMEEADPSPSRTFSEVFQEVRSFISTLECIEELEEICQTSLAEIRRLSGFDGARMYRFDEQWNGKVIAEDIVGGLESYLGQTFPASDVPKQVRALYIRNPFRLISNRDYVPQRLFPVINPVTNGFTDLSDCNLRSVAGVHLEYMANMNVSASMSIRVMVDGNLWGLISCHHVTARHPSFELRSIFEWLSMEISHRISSVLKQQQLRRSRETLLLQGEIHRAVYHRSDIVLGLTEDGYESLCSLFKCKGMMISLNGKIYSKGSTPPPEELDNLLLWASGVGFNKIFTSSELSNSYDEARSYQQTISGLISIPINSRKGDYLICFRPEAVKDIKWGGNPNQAVNFENNSPKYHPRTSFKLWLQTVYGQSEAWSETDLESAESLKNFLMESSASFAL